MRIRAITITNNGDGTVNLGLPMREMTQQESNVLDKLFPNSTHEIEKLLERESLLHAIDIPFGHQSEPTRFFDVDGNRSM